MSPEYQSGILPAPFVADGVATARPVIVVLGAHRAGTSLLMSVLGAGGVSLGSDLLAGDEWNPRGYWEVEEIYQAQDRILEALGRPWRAVEGIEALPPDWLGRAEVREEQGRLADVVRRQVASSRGVWAFKDPRTATLLPLWQAIFDEMGLEPIYVLALRHPRAVARSLARRDGMPEPHGQLLWLRTYLDALRHTRGRIHALVEYERWFSDAAPQLDALFGALDGMDLAERGALHERVLPLVAADLRHHAAAGDEGCHPLVARLYGWLRESAADPAALRDPERIEALGEQARQLCTAWQLGHWRDQCYPLNLFDKGRLDAESAARAEVWNVRVADDSARCLFLQPNARIALGVPEGAAGKLRFSLGMHPKVWEHPSSGGVLFSTTVDDRVKLVLTLDARNRPADRRWHDFEIDVPASQGGCHEVVFETRWLGADQLYRWALWKEPVFTCRDEAAATGRSE